MSIEEQKYDPTTYSLDKISTQALRNGSAISSVYTKLLKDGVEFHKIANSIETIEKQSMQAVNMLIWSLCLNVCMVGIAIWILATGQP